MFPIYSPPVRTVKQARATLTKVGPHGFIHGWIQVGAGDIRPGKTEAEDRADSSSKDMATRAAARRSVVARDNVRMAEGLDRTSTPLDRRTGDVRPDKKSLEAKYEAKRQKAAAATARADKLDTDEAHDRASRYHTAAANAAGKLGEHRREQDHFGASFLHNGRSSQLFAQSRNPGR